jgi:hypothetical protein
MAILFLEKLLGCCLSKYFYSVNLSFDNYLGVLLFFYVYAQENDFATLKNKKLFNSGKWSFQVFFIWFFYFLFFIFFFSFFVKVFIIFNFIFRI